MTAPVSNQTPLSAGKVKQVLSGDTIVIKGSCKYSRPPEHTWILSYVLAPKLAKRKGESQDEPFAWQSKEFLRKKLLGQFVYCVKDTTNTQRDTAVVYLGTDDSGQNINELMVAEGWVNLKGDVLKSRQPEHQKIIDLFNAAKAEGKGIHNKNPDDCIRKITWTVPPDRCNAMVEEFEKKPVKAIIEQVRDGSTVRAFLLPSFEYITLMMSGIKSPQFKMDSDGKPDLRNSNPLADEARCFTELRLLQHEVEIILESVLNNGNFVGTIIHPKGNIAEELLKTGLANCFDPSLAKMDRAEVDKFRQAEKLAKEKRIRMWKDYNPPPPLSDKEWSATVVEIINGDALMVKLADGTVKKIFLSSIRPPRGNENKPPSGGRNRLLYDVPWMFEAREFLRKKLIGKKVHVVKDYIQPPRDKMAEKVCCTVTIANVNVAEALVSRGLAAVIKHRQNDERSSSYDDLISAENKASKLSKGIHAKKDIPTHRINDYSGDPSRAKAFLPHLTRMSMVDALVEYVVSGSKLRLFIPKDSSLITFLLSGINIRAKREDGVSNEEEALKFTKEKCLQREVQIRVEQTDRIGSNFIGWLWVENINLSVALVENGLAQVHFSGENSEYGKQLLNAKNVAKSNKLWKFVEQEEVKEEVEEGVKTERQVKYDEVMVVVTSGISFYCQFAANEHKLMALQQKLGQELTANPPLPGAYSPKKGDICAAKYKLDDMWYRAKVERVSGGKVSVIYVDYGNEDEVMPTDCSQLPASLSTRQESPYAHHFTLAHAKMANDNDYQAEAETAFFHEVSGKKLLLNQERSINGVSYASLVHPGSKEDVARKLISEGLLLVDFKPGQERTSKLVADYKEAEEDAKKNRLYIWQYGDVREDDDKEFGMGR